MLSRLFSYILAVSVVCVPAFATDFNVLVVGDSFAAGIPGVRDGYLPKLSTRLNQYAPSSLTIDFVGSHLYNGFRHASLRGLPMSVPLDTSKVLAESPFVGGTSNGITWTNLNGWLNSSYVIPGQSTPELSNVSAVILQLGYNDVQAGVWNSISAGGNKIWQTHERDGFETDMYAMINKITAEWPGVHVFVCNATQISDHNGFWQWVIDDEPLGDWNYDGTTDFSDYVLFLNEMNRGIRDINDNVIALAGSNDVTVIDLDSVIDAHHQADGVHPNSTGESRIAGELGYEIQLYYNW